MARQRRKQGLVGRLLRWAGLAVAALVAVVVLIVVWGGTTFARAHARTFSIPPVTLTLSVAKADAARGRRLARIRMACTECHGDDLAGGKMLDKPPVGRVYGPNITPHKLRDWTDGEIARAIRDGVGRDGHPLMIMPAQDFQYTSQEDLVDIIAYVRSVPASDKPDGPKILGPVMKVLYALGKVSKMFAADVVRHGAPFPPAVKEGPTAAFGSYIVHNSCIGCHREDLTGGKIDAGPPDWPPAANLTPDALSSWSEADFIKTLRTGVDPSGATLRDPMAKLIQKHGREFRETELKAIWAYLVTVKGKIQF